MGFSDELSKVVGQVNRVLPAVATIGDIFNPSDDHTGSIEAGIRAGAWNGSGPVNPTLARQTSPVSLNDQLLGVKLDATGQPTGGDNAQAVKQGPQWFGIAAAISAVALLFLALRK